MLKTFILEEGSELTEEERRSIREARGREIQFDEDCPELSPRMMERFRQAVAERNRRRAEEQKEEGADGLWAPAPGTGRGPDRETQDGRSGRSRCTGAPLNDKRLARPETKRT